MPTPTDQQIVTVADRLVDNGQALPGLIIAGRGESDPDAIAELAKLLGWPIVADHRSGLRDGRALRFHDPLFRATTDLNQQVRRVLRFGEPLSSKVLGQWLTDLGDDPTAVTGFTPWSRTINPEGVIHLRLAERLAASMLVAELRDRRTLAAPAGWLDRWSKADAGEAASIGTRVADPASEPGIAAAALAAVPRGGSLVVSSSMPVRDIEWYGPDVDGVAVYSNRGANGIDGVVATAIGVACTGAPTVCLIGDVALLHDQSSLIALVQRDIDLTIVVVNNDGGGIFSFLPQHDQLDSATYELLFGTPHGTDIATVFAAHGIRVGDRLEPGGVRAAVFRTDRDSSLQLRQSLHK